MLYDYSLHYNKNPEVHYHHVNNLAERVPKYK